MDIENDLQNRKVAAQFRYSLFKYMLSEDFNPKSEVDYEMIKEIFL